jgi:hypothetical protein
MAYGAAIRTEHAGAKKGQGAWAVKSFAKKASKKARRANDKKAVQS